MKLRKLSVLVAGGFLSVTLGATAFAYDRKYGDGQTNWYEHGDSSAGPLKNTIKGNHLGTAATLQNASRQIVLGNNTKYVNVKSGETVKFVADGKSFAWNFNTLGTPTFQLAEIAPAGLPVGAVRVYVAAGALDAN